MLRSFFIITLRLMWRNKLISFINIFSLSIGIMAFILIMLYVHHEMSYDMFNENYDRIYRLEGDDFGKLPPVIGQYVKDHVPEVENIALLAGGGKPFFSYIPENDPENIKQVEGNFFWADSTIFKVFTISLLTGNPRKALVEPFSAVISESMARKLFDDSDPIMKNIVVNNNTFTITGIIRDVKNSHFPIDVLCSQESVSRVYPDRNLNHTGPNSWLWSATYLLISAGNNERYVEEKINQVLSAINDGSLFDLKFNHFYLRSLKSIYFYGDVVNLGGYGFHGNIKLVQVLTIVAVLILLLACFNYMNLTTARSILRTKEISIKKIVGSSKSMLGFQFIVESLFVTIISFLIALTLTQIFITPLRTITSFEITFPDSGLPIFFGVLISGILIIGLLAGIYPAFYLASTRSPLLKTLESSRGTKGSVFRKSLMTLQFSISITMIACVIAVNRQLHYVRTKNLGITIDRVLMIPTPGNFPEEYSRRTAFRDKLLSHREIQKVAFSNGNPGSRHVATAQIKVNDDSRIIGFFNIDPDYLELLGIEMKEGRNFSWDRIGEKFNFDKTDPVQRLPSDKRGVILNEAAIRESEMDSPLGKLIWNNTTEIIGIMQDFHFKSLHDQIGPLAFIWTSPGATANIKIASGDIPASLKMIEKEFKNIYGSVPFSYQFLDESFNTQYRKDEQLATVMGYFSLIAIVIACMGLFALSTFMVNRRTKEIGIRKTLGATVKTIYAMLSWDFLKWILLAAIIACPIGWYVMNKWLESFAYHIKLGPDIFIIAVLIAVGIALLTITWQAIKTARANPVEALRYE